MFRQLVLSRPTATIATIIVCAIGIALGFWQVGRMEQKLALAAEVAKKENSAPLFANGKPWTLEEALHHRMIAKGTYLADKTIWLENRPHPMGRDPKTGITVGFYVMTPLLLEHSKQILWVNRGWVPRDGMDREKLPELMTPTGVIQVEGLIFEHPARVMSVGNQEAEAQKRKIQQNLDLKQQELNLGIQHLPFILREVSDLKDGISRDWAPLATGAEKHQGYAFQWFSLAALAVIFWFLSGVLRKKL
jgi:cytochrome oxidase assembly protein ShyY1